MAADDANKGGTAGDVDNIRKILFGDQISQMEERFSQNEAAIAQLRAENRNLRQALEAELTQRESSLEEIKQLLFSTQKNIEENILATWGAMQEKIHADHEAENQALTNAREKLLGAFSQTVEEYLGEVRAAHGKKP